MAPHQGSNGHNWAPSTHLAGPKPFSWDDKAAGKSNKVSEETQQSRMGTTLNRIGQMLQFSSKKKLCLHDELLIPFKLGGFCFFEALGHLPISIENTSEIIKTAARRPAHLESDNGYLTPDVPKAEAEFQQMML